MASSRRIENQYPPRLFVVTTNQVDPANAYEMHSRDDRFCGIPWCWKPPARGTDSRGNIKLYCEPDHQHLEL